MGWVATIDRKREVLSPIEPRSLCGLHRCLNCLGASTQAHVGVLHFCPKAHSKVRQGQRLESHLTLNEAAATTRKLAKRCAGFKERRCLVSQDLPSSLPAIKLLQPLTGVIPPSEVSEATTCHRLPGFNNCNFGSVMRLASGHICAESASTSYTQNASSSAITPRPSFVRARQDKRPHRSLRAHIHASSGAQEQWDRLELITRSVVKQNNRVSLAQKHIALPTPYNAVARRKLAVAVSEEDYNLAAQLNSEKQLLAQDLPAVSQYTFHQLQQLQTGIEMGSLSQQLSSLRALGKT